VFTARYALSPYNKTDTLRLWRINMRKQEVAIEFFGGKSPDRRLDWGIPVLSRGQFSGIKFVYQPAEENPTALVSNRVPSTLVRYSSPASHSGSDLAKIKTFGFQNVLKNLLISLICNSRNDLCSNIRLSFPAVSDVTSSPGFASKLPNYY
jgi:hypothetical protein